MNGLDSRRWTHADGANRRLAAIGLALVLLATASAAHGQEAPAGGSPWIFRTRALITGSSDESDPAGYKVYSAFPIEVGVSRRLGDRFSAELDLRTESREVDVDEGGARDTRLGSIELLPISLVGQFHSRRSGGMRPYFGAGVNFTLCWEKSGAIDASDLSPSVGPVVQLGADFPLSASALLNLDLRWNLLRPELERVGKPKATLKIDAASLGVGLGFRF